MSGSLHADGARRVSGFRFRLYDDEMDELGELETVVLDGLFALVTTIIGATIGANLTLLGLDIAWDRQAHDRFAADALQPRPVTG